VPEVADISGVLKREQDALAIETRIAQCPPFVAVSDLAEVTRVPSQLRFHHPASLEKLPGAKGVAFIVTCPSLNSKVLWVGAANDKYRDEYLTFLDSAYGISMTSLPPGYDVDHLYNRARALHYGLTYVRLALVRQAVNRSHGAAYEKDITRNEAARERRHMKLMDEITSMKYFGFLSPLRDDPREAEIDAYAAFAAAKLGLDPQEIRRGILLLRKKASTPWARAE